MFMFSVELVDSVISVICDAYVSVAFHGML